MAEERKPYRRESEDKRRLALISATLSLAAEGGLRAATVRAIAARAGVTAGLIRHYFQSKENLIAESYRHLMMTMNDESAAVLTYAPKDPMARLAAFVVASLKPPVMVQDAVVRWASFMQETRDNAEIRAIHAQTYLAYRDQLQSLIAALPEQRSPAELRQLAIAANAVIDGLWVEGGVLPEAFDKGELVRIGLRAVGALLGVDLTRYLLLSEPPTP